MKEVGVEDSALEQMREWTLGQRTGDGLWTPFWWTFNAYATAHMLEFLAATGGIPADVVEASRHYLEKKTDSTTAMESANLLMMALRVGVCSSPWISPLLGQQRFDGGWPPSRVLKVPDQKTACGDGEAFEDMKGLMSTAMAVMALTELLENNLDQA
jgi:hypothetical protein